MAAFLRRLHSIGPRIGASVIVLIVTAVGLVGWFGYSQQRDLNTLSTDTQLKQAYDRVRDVLKAREEQALTLSNALANSPGFAEHLDRKDRAWLFENFTPTFNAARAQGIDLINGFRLSGLDSSAPNPRSKKRVRP